MTPSFFIKKIKFDFSISYALPFLKFITAFSLFTVFTNSQDYQAIRAQFIAVPVTLVLSSFIITDILREKDLRIAISKIVLQQAILITCIIFGLILNYQSFALDFLFICLIQSLFLDMIVYSEDKDAQEKTTRILMMFELCLVVFLILSIFKYDKVLLYTVISIFRLSLIISLVRNLKITHSMLQQPKVSLDFLLPRLAGAIAVSIMGVNVSNIVQFSLFIRFKTMLEIMIPVLIRINNTLINLLFLIVIVLAFLCYLHIFDFILYIESIFVFVLVGVLAFQLSYSNQRKQNQMIQRTSKINNYFHLIYFIICLSSAVYFSYAPIGYIHFIITGLFLYTILSIHNWKSW